MNKKTFTAIIFFSNKIPAKYRNITNVKTLITFATGKGAMYINFYDKQTKNFEYRHTINNKKTKK